MKKTIVVHMNKKSIDKAVSQLNKLRNSYPKMQKEFLMAVAKWIAKKADGYIEQADLGSLVKNELHNGWDYEQTANGIKIINNANVEKTIGGQKQTVPLAVIVEFGSGVVGQSQAHPNANAEGYEYNKLDSGRKSADGTWGFYTNSNELDLPQNSIFVERSFNDKRGVGGASGNRLLITTRGAKGVMYAYNAIVDAKMDLANPNGELATEWNKILERYIG